MVVENLLKILAEKGRRFTIAYKCLLIDNVVCESISSVTLEYLLWNSKL